MTDQYTDGLRTFDAEELKRRAAGGWQYGNTRQRPAPPARRFLIDDLEERGLRNKLEQLNDSSIKRALGLLDQVRADWEQTRRMPHITWHEWIAEQRQREAAVLIRGTLRYVREKAERDLKLVAELEDGFLAAPE